MHRKLLRAAAIAVAALAATIGGNVAQAHANSRSGITLPNLDYIPGGGAGGGYVEFYTSAKATCTGRWLTWGWYQYENNGIWNYDPTPPYDRVQDGVNCQGAGTWGPPNSQASASQCFGTAQGNGTGALGYWGAGNQGSWRNTSTTAANSSYMCGPTLARNWRYVFQLVDYSTAAEIGVEHSVEFQAVC